jgi:RNA polymerase sigma factor (sigma-70 family)
MVEGHRLFDKIYQDYYSSLLRVVQQKITSRELAEDVLQDAFIKIWIALPSYDPLKGGIFAWMATICSHMALDQIRSKYTKQKCLTEPLKITTEQSCRLKHFMIDVDQIDLIFQVHKLRKIYEEPLMLFSIGYTHVEIGKMLNIPLGTVKSRIRAGSLILRKIWAI